ncbi:hypothetical protein KPH14_007349 [Odynerus spinipes]|uniref:Uncharacterized protein n=1 Tax=Odynerus spinipes TaxID=1348599 RepID=A0AAD9VJG9_9HYME|nr:hypothetical protein KPH14_007349 [Odynerus spinipes]
MDHATHGLYRGKGGYDNSESTALSTRPGGAWPKAVERPSRRSLFVFYPFVVIQAAASSLPSLQQQQQQQQQQEVAKGRGGRR